MNLQLPNHICLMFCPNHLQSLFYFNFLLKLMECNCPIKYIIESNKIEHPFVLGTFKRMQLTEFGMCRIAYSELVPNPSSFCIEA